VRDAVFDLTSRLVAIDSVNPSLVPGGEGAHAAVEWVSIGDTAAVTETLIAVARGLCA